MTSKSIPVALTWPVIEPGVNGRYDGRGRGSGRLDSTAQNETNIKLHAHECARKGETSDEQRRLRRAASTLVHLGRAKLAMSQTNQREGLTRTKTKTKDGVHENVSVVREEVNENLRVQDVPAYQRSAYKRHTKRRSRHPESCKYAGIRSIHLITYCIDRVAGSNLEELDYLHFKTFNNR